jgi:DNA helicase-2/ATP-dependent DNA helicase PcrA
MNSLLENLNTEQRAAVDAAIRGGPVLVLAGAGTGKTTTLIALLAVINYPDVLAITFTNKAANEIKERIIRTTGRGLYWCGTFHSVCLKILRREKQALGQRSDFIVFGEDDQKKVLKTVFAELNLDKDDYDPANWIEAIAFYKDTGTRRINKDNFDIILDAYNAELTRLNAVDFADIINHTIALLKSNPAILNFYQDKFRHILVDEFQDTNAPQYELLRLLSDKHKNIICVGDDDQSIYSWRGAQIRNILNFEKDFPGAKIITLTKNYRSTRNILNAANSLIRHNRGRLGKDLTTDADDGDKVKVVEFASGDLEAAAIASAIERADKKRDFAILIRNGSLSAKFEKEFNMRRIPYKLVGAQKFYDRMEIQDAVAYMRLLAHRFDDMAFLRIISRPRRGLGDAAITELRRYAATHNKSLFDSLKEIQLKTKQRQSADEFIKAFDFAWAKMTPDSAAQELLENSGYIKMWQESKDENADERLQNIYELINGTIANFDSIESFLENASLMIADDEAPVDDADAVPIMTIHAAKGLEFDNVFLPAWEEGIFPNEKKNSDDIEEERRLAYVAITRARKNVMISYAMTRFIYGKEQYNPMSRFVGEISDEYKDTGIKEAPPRHRVNNFYSLNKKPSMVGQLVNHNELGSGVVIEDGGDILTVAFKNKGIKKIAKRFLSP